jgi:hypothetical protein
MTKLTVLNLPRKHEAEMLLQRVFQDVSNLMNHYGWRIARLTEFVEPGLLGKNVNKTEIFIRLRKEADTFYEYYFIFGTMLHELVHMKIAPHGDRFDAFLNKLYEEHESGKFANERFVGTGRRLGGHSGGTGRRLGGHSGLLGAGRRLGGRPEVIVIDD